MCNHRSTHLSFFYSLEYKIFQDISHVLWGTTLATGDREPDISTLSIIPTSQDRHGVRHATLRLYFLLALTGWSGTGSTFIFQTRSEKGSKVHSDTETGWKTTVVLYIVGK